MYNSKIAGLGFYVPENVVTNDDLSKLMDTSDEWIQERTGIRERRHVVQGTDTTTSMGVKAAEIAIDRAGVSKDDIDFIVFATLSPDYYFPGPGVLVQRDLGLKTVGALDVRNQCSGFVYGVSVADQYIKSGMYKNVLVIGSELHSHGLDMTTRGRGSIGYFWRWRWRSRFNKGRRHLKRNFIIAPPFRGATCRRTFIDRTGNGQKMGHRYYQ